MAMENIKKSLSYKEWIKRHKLKIIDIKSLSGIPYNFNERIKFLEKKNINYNRQYKIFENFIAYKLNRMDTFKFKIKIFSDDGHVCGDFFNDNNIFELKQLQADNVNLPRISYAVNKVKAYFENLHTGCNSCNCLKLNYYEMNMYYIIYKDSEYDDTNIFLYKLQNNNISYDEWKETVKFRTKNKFYIDNDSNFKEIGTIKIPKFLRLILGITKSKQELKKK